MNQLNHAILLFTLTLGHAWGAGFEGIFNTRLGQNAGSAAGDAGFNVFIGRYAGFSTTGGSNTFVGFAAGSNTTGGGDNTFLGLQAGRDNTTGSNNTFLGNGAGSNITTGSLNTFIGYNAGLHVTGSNRLFIANSGTTTPLIYGEFDNNKVTVNGNLSVVGPNAGLVRLTDVTTNAATKGARLVLNHYNNASLPVYMLGAASTASQNILAFGGGNVIGNAATQLDFFTATTNTTPYGTSRMTIAGNGNIGMGVTSPAHPLHMASGALVTTGGVWTNASSRDYKENIRTLGNKEAMLTLAKLNPVTYNYKADKTQGHVGFIAEDVPELVATQDRRGLSPMDIVAVLTKVVKEQQEAIEELKEQNKLIPALSAELKELKQEVRMGRTTAIAYPQ